MGKVDVKVKSYSSDKDLEKDAKRMIRDGYTIAAQRGGFGAVVTVTWVKNQ